MHAVIKTGGKQYIVKPGDVIDIEKISGEPGEEVNFEEVLLVSAEGEDVKVGSPVVENARVEGRIVKQKRGEKIVVFKFKRRKGYRKKAGHRQNLTSVEITSISA
ncbi:MAG: 50S ribosomal protein L21 [Candidatus Dadabacteria bacterium]|nr:50S ribosomal protein L21 [Candidatus Dadabacteria bacterium]MDE0519806.1 50S ribosomal protein L21 [Candidatus Dadabacteria bacterium]MDE0662706.1 50S ribosomal protein L21 [Candidatus Dadabacteria bacterium]